MADPPKIPPGEKLPDKSTPEEDPKPKGVRVHGTSGQSPVIGRPDYGPPMSNLTRNALELLRRLHQEYGDNPEKIRDLPAANAPVEVLHSWYEKYQRDHARWLPRGAQEIIEDAAAALNTGLVPIGELPPTKRKTWIHRIPVWKEFGHWFRWATILAGAAATASGFGEYALALVLLLCCLICCLAQIHVWQTERSWKAKVFLALLSIGLISYGAIVVIGQREGKRWGVAWPRQSDPATPKAETSAPNNPKAIPTATPLNESPGQEEGKRVEGNVFLSEEYPAIGDTKTFTFFGIKNYGAVKIKARFGLSRNFVIILLIHSTEDEPGIAAGDCLTAINNYQAIVDDLKVENKKRSPEFIDFAIEPNLICHYDYAKDITPEASEALKRIALRKNLVLSIEGPRGPK